MCPGQSGTVVGNPRQERRPIEGGIPLIMRYVTYHAHIILLHYIMLSTAGFEDVIQVHFAIQREAIMKQLSQWLKEVISSEHQRKLCNAIDHFRAELDKL